MKALLSGGGTAGHVHPALSVAARLLAEHDDVVFVGTPDGLESRIVPAAGVRFVGLPARGFDRARPLTLITSSARIVASAFSAWRLLRMERPDVVIGFGGYVSIPVGLAAVVARVPLVLHEQNSVPGLANRVLARFAASVGVTYEESGARLSHPGRVTVTGNPVREEMLHGDRDSGRNALGVPDDAFLLLVFGGSRGARHINEAVAALAPRLLADERVRVLHLSGANEVESTRAAVADALAKAVAGVDQEKTSEQSTGAGDPDPRWMVRGYLEDMASALHAADLVIARAGATSIAELTAVGAPVILVPYPYATDDHQTKNAAALAASGAAVVVADADLDDAGFAQQVLDLVGDGERRATMSAASRAAGRTDAAARLVALARAASRPSHPLGRADHS